jgi:hypothetical protein
VDGAGNLFIADYANDRIRKVTPDGIIHTIAGNGTYGTAGDGGPAANAEMAPATSSFSTFRTGIYARFRLTESLTR